MKIPSFWTHAWVDDQGEPVEQPGGSRACFVAHGWSDGDPAEARARALERARRVAQRVAGGESQELQEWYAYGDRPVREAIIDRNDEQGWIITRNAYGSLVLNTDRVMFIDLDDPVPQRSSGGLLGALFGRKSKADDEDHGAVVRRRVADVVSALDGINLRLYRTAAGFRAIVTSECYEPASDLARQTLDAFEADPAYVRLCGIQESFRARLTPKPWRCSGVAAPEVRFPFKSEQETRRFDRWLRRYEKVIGRYAVCEMVETIGSGQIIDAARPIIDLHDRHVLGEGRPLA